MASDLRTMPPPDCALRLDNTGRRGVITRSTLTGAPRSAAYESNGCNAEVGGSSPPRPTTVSTEPRRAAAFLNILPRSGRLGRLLHVCRVALEYRFEIGQPTSNHRQHDS